MVGLGASGDPAPGKGASSSLAASLTSTGDAGSMVALGVTILCTGIAVALAGRSLGREVGALVGRGDRGRGRTGRND
jgi:hypothetical protein